MSDPKEDKILRSELGVSQQVSDACDRFFKKRGMFNSKRFAAASMAELDKKAKKKKKKAK